MQRKKHDPFIVELEPLPSRQANTDPLQMPVLRDGALSSSVKEKMKRRVLRGTQRLVTWAHHFATHPYILGQVRAYVRSVDQQLEAPVMRHRILLLRHGSHQCLLYHSSFNGLAWVVPSHLEVNLDYTLPLRHG